MKLHGFLLLGCLSVCAYGSSLGTSILFHPGANSGEGYRPTSGTTFAEDSWEVTFDSSTYKAYGKAQADYGVLKAISTLSLTDYPSDSFHQDCLVGGDPAICFIADPTAATANFTDTWTISGGSGSGYLVLKLVIDGSTILDTGLTGYTTSQGSIVVRADSAYYLNTGFKNVNNTFYTDPIPFTYDVPFNVFVELVAFQVVYDPASLTGPTYNLDASADYFNTATLTGVSAYTDQNQQNPVNIRLLSESEEDYPVTEVQANAVPEPGTWMMMLGALPLIGIARRRFSR